MLVIPSGLAQRGRDEEPQEEEEDEEEKELKGQSSQSPSFLLSRLYSPI